MKQRVGIFGIQIDPMTLEHAARKVLEWSVCPSSGCRFVVTPNVDHVVMLRELSALRAVYQDAHLVLADGWPVVAASQLLGHALPERVAGSDLVPRVFDLASVPVRVFLLGAMPGVAERAKARIEARWSNVQVVGTHSPPFGFENDPHQCERILQQIATAHVDILVVGLGARKTRTLGASTSYSNRCQSGSLRWRDHRLPGRGEASRAALDAKSWSGMVTSCVEGA